MISRRTLLSWIGAAATLRALPACSLFSRRELLPYTDFIEDFSPIERDPSARIWSGDSDPTTAHEWFWNFEKMAAERGGVPTPTEETRVVVIGGGVSGLFSAYQTRGLKPVVLEAAPRFGGNARGESWDGLHYSIGAAYYMNPKPGDLIYPLFNELGLRKFATIKESGDPVLWNGKIYDEYFDGETASGSRNLFRKFNEHLLQVSRGMGGLSYPEIPVSDGVDRKNTERYDSQSFADYLKMLLRGRVPAELDAALNLYCLSSFAARPDELSAAHVMNFLAGEVDELCVLPAGNAFVAETILKKLTESIPEQNLRTRSTVVRVERRDESVWVTYLNSEGQLRTIRSRVVVMSIPKFVAKKVLVGTEEKRRLAYESLEYRSYVVANALVKSQVPSKRYDLFLMPGEVNAVFKKPGSVFETSATDVVLANFSSPMLGRTVFTFYCPIGLSGTRNVLLNESDSRLKNVFVPQIERVLKDLNVPIADLKEIRWTRWGHPIPVARRGCIIDGTVDWLRRPFAERVFFVEQDNWLLPTIEGCAAEAILWTNQIIQRATT